MWALKDGENSAGRSWAAERVGVCDGCGGLGTDLPGDSVGLWFLHPAVLQQPETFYKYRFLGSTPSKSQLSLTQAWEHSFFFFFFNFILFLNFT